VAHFKYHTLPITSIEWSPHEASTLSVTSADHQLTYSSKLFLLTLPESGILSARYFYTLGCFLRIIYVSTFLWPQDMGFIIRKGC
jgi:hypothetical protein